MATKIGLISDVHASPPPLAEALSLFSEAQVEGIYCLGDIAGYGDALDKTVDLLITSKCQSILGNHDVWYMDKATSDDKVTSYFKTLPPLLDLQIEGKRIYMVHASPPYSFMEGMKLLDENEALIPELIRYWRDYLAEFEYDALIVGHTHQVFFEELGRVKVMNPGSTLFNHSCAILHLPEMKFQLLPLSGKAISKVWNWGANQVITDE